ncbi:hypothetical protein [Aestuariicoccus sp. MJ-SS9]|uniref:hypothetical protein n=1 Tax=Aestuariicoccus sp. MJ-SS9 TaxID=3079855 RepID=UPI0029105BA7|nr:hypothetical protein [Aestuariicoccus sp. MJ-SS9]MDU8912551.1 hypothetical protein [Aestuariicoccus sp. MJ-SS9]
MTHARFGPGKTALACAGCLHVRATRRHRQSLGLPMKLDALACSRGIGRISRTRVRVSARQRLRVRRRLRLDEGRVALGCGEGGQVASPRTIPQVSQIVDTLECGPERAGALGELLIQHRGDGDQPFKPLGGVREADQPSGSRWRCHSMVGCQRA